MDALKAETEKIRLMNEDRSHNLDILRSDSRSSERTLLNMSDTEMEEKRRSTDLEKEAAEGLLPKTVTKDHVTADPLARAKLMFWMVVNTVATVMIVSRWLNKTFGPNDISRPHRRATTGKRKMLIHLAAGLLQQSHLH